MRFTSRIIATRVLAAGLCLLPISVQSAAQTPQVEVLELEVNQGVQNLKNGVPFVAGRDALVRAYVVTATGTAPVGGRLVISREGEAAADVIAPQAPLIAVPLAQRPLAELRQELENTLNFVVPGNMIRGAEITMRVELLESGSPLGCPKCQKSVARRPLVVPPLRVRIVVLRYRVGDRTFEPRPEDFTLLSRWLEQAYPVPSVDISVTTVDAANKWPFNCHQARTQVRQLRAAEVGNAANIDPRTHYYAIVFGDSSGTFMEGCAPVPSTPDPATVGAGPTGPVPATDPKFSWDTDASFGDWYAGHEIGHTLGRAHPGMCESADPRDPAYSDTPGPRLFTSTLLAQSDAPHDFVGLDRRFDPWKVLPGRLWNDVMDYCKNQWLSAHTYEALASRLIAEEASLSPFGGEITTGPGLTETPAIAAGLGISNDGSPQSASDPAPAQPPSPAPQTLPTSSQKPPSPPAAPRQVAAPPPVAEGQLMLLIAHANLARGTSVIESMVPVSRTYSKSYGAPRDEKTGAVLRVRYSGGATQLYGCDMHAISQDKRENTEPPQPASAASTPTAAVQPPDYDTTIECTFQREGEPVLATVLIDGKPVAEQASPRGNLRLRSAGAIGGGLGLPGKEPSPLVVTWNPSGQSPNTRYLVKMSRDAGTTWEVIAVGLKDTELEIPATTIRGASAITVEITAVDGMRTAVIDTKILTVSSVPKP